MRRLALAVSALLLMVAGLSVLLVSASTGKPRPVARPPIAVPAPALPRGIRPLAVPNGACYVGLPQCSIHGCAQYVAPVAQAPVSASAVDSVLPAVAVAPQPAVRPRSTRCIAPPAQRTVSATAPIITATPAEPAVTAARPAKP